ncbi:hypothetical protein N0V88_001610 [Collariella sp. IMI 366227]|nr:hypothetical protein N0V88_001610 [Collariella sp. IMI 366227]
MARRSARIASLSKASEAPTLSSVAEQEAHSAHVPVEQTDNVAPALSSIREPKTPGRSSPAKPPISEMHPSKVHATMGPLSTGLCLGFTDIKPAAKRDDILPAAVQTTPSRMTVPASEFTFSVTRQKPAADLGLSDEARHMMEEIRGQADKFKADLRAQQEVEKLEEEQAAGRKIAQAKGKAGRFSSVHMAEFKKMDSIANHPSAFRYQVGRSTPLKAGVKRSQSKANLDEPEPSKQSTPATAAKSKRPAAAEEPVATAKRARQHMDDDASSKRPASRDGSSIPMPKSAGLPIPRSKVNLASLMTPTKSALARSTSVKTPSHSLARAASVKTPSQGLLPRSPSKPTLSGIPRSATTNNLSAVTAVTEKQPAPAAELQTPRSRFERVKAMFHSAKASASKPTSTLPLPSAFASKTPAPARLQKELPPVPMTTPGRKLTKRVAFTPETQRAALTQNSPPRADRSWARCTTLLDGVMAEAPTPTEVSYPPLSARRPLPEPPIKSFKATAPEPSAPGEFTFRSDHTISFGTTTTTSSFGSSQAKQASALLYLALPHGMSTKKRHRVSTDEEEVEQEAAERAAKKRRGETVPEGRRCLRRD